MRQINIPILAKDFRLLTFYGGEPHMDVPTIDTDELYILARINNWTEFGNLLLLLNALSAQEFETHKKLILYVPYFPGARQDRNPGGNTPLTVTVYAETLAAQLKHFDLFDEVMLCVFDIHSDTALDLIDHSVYFCSIHVVNLLPSQLDLNVFDDDYNGIIAPDEGAIDRAFDMGAAMNLPVITCHKVREFGTGRITNYQLPVITTGKKWLVVDDICDGGATFNLLARAFAEQVPDGILHLYVSHGIFSKGVSAIDSLISKIYTTDSFASPYHMYDDPRLVVLPIPDPFDPKVIP